VLLFWILDRTSALYDTSLLAALVVALTYERILSGQSQTFRTPGAVSSLWSPFVAYANDLAKSVRDHVFRREKRFRRRLLDQVAADDEHYEAFKQLALTYANDIAKLEDDLKNLDKLKGSLGLSAVAEKKAKLLNKSLVGVDDLDRLMLEKKVISRSTYYLYVKSIHRKALVVMFVGFLALALAQAFLSLRDPNMLINYYVWRLEKPDTTQTDRFRAKENLATYLVNPNTATLVFDEINSALRSPALSTAQVDDILQILLAHRCRSLETKMNYPLPRQLTESLRTTNVDSRDRINRTLVYLAKEYGEVNDDLSNWNPSGTLIDELEGKIDEWKHFWDAHNNLVNGEKCT